MRWSEPERAQAVYYEPGLVVQFDQNVKGGIRRGGRFAVSARDGNRVTLTDKNGRIIDLPLSMSKDFSVYRAGTIDLAVGDLVRTTKNGRIKTVKDGEMQESKINNATWKRPRASRKTAISSAEGARDSKGLWPSAARRYHHQLLLAKPHRGPRVDGAHAKLDDGHQYRAVLLHDLARQKSARIFTDDKEALFDALRHTSARMSATDLISGPPPVQEIRPTLPQRMQSQGHRARRAYYAFCERGPKLSASVWTLGIIFRQRPQVPTISNRF